MHSRAAAVANNATLIVTRHWICPNCKKEGTTGAVVGTPMHICPKLRYLAAPMVPKGTPAKVELQEREDYVGNEAVQLDPERRRPVMSITTVRDRGKDGRPPGQDVIVLAPVARVRGEA